jgi:hypothetical protein
VDPTIAALIARAVESSSTFRRVVETIDATDGIVYIEPGRCAIARSCLILRVKIAGPSRLLRIRVDPKRPDCEVMASIAHELWHTVEVLRELALRTDAAVFFFYARESRRPDRTGDPSGTWETPEAVKTGDDVRAELRRRLVDDPRRQAC